MTHLLWNRIRMKLLIGMCNLFSWLCPLSSPPAPSLCFLSRWCKCSRAAGGRTLPLTFTAWPRLPIETSWPLARTSPLSCWERVVVARPPTVNTSSNTCSALPAAPTKRSPVGWQESKMDVVFDVLLRPPLLKWLYFSLLSVAEKWQAVYTVLEAFGNASTCINGNASRFSHIVSLDFDQAGLVTSASIQVQIAHLFIYLFIHATVCCSTSDFPTYVHLLCSQTVYHKLV